MALENDLCLCRCSDPPRLLPNQSCRYQNLKDQTDEGMSAARTGKDATGGVNAFLTFDDKYILFDDDTGERLTNTEYAIRRATGEVEFGNTDKEGHTHLLAAVASAETIEIYL